MFGLLVLERATKTAVLFSLLEQPKILEASQQWRFANLEAESVIRDLHNALTLSNESRLTDYFFHLSTSYLHTDLKARQELHMKNLILKKVAYVWYALCTSVTLQRSLSLMNLHEWD